MATGQILLPIPGGLAPSGVQACGSKLVTSSSTPSNGAAARFVRLQFDQTTDEHWLWVVRIPENYLSTPQLVFHHGADVTTGNVVWKYSFAPNADGTDDLDMIATNTVGTTTVAVPGTSGVTTKTTVSPDASDLTFGRLLGIMLGRDAGDGSDTAAGDAWIVGAAFIYTAQNA